MEEKAERGLGIETDLPTLVFLGTPEFALPSLHRLAAAGATILLAVTQPDRPSGRGKKVLPPPVKVAAEALRIPVFQPARIKEQPAMEHIRSHGAECAVVVAYGQILPQAFLDAFPLGALNVHASMLPRHRGAAPIQRSLLAGDSATGVTIMLLDAGMDTGPMLSQQEIPLREGDTFGAVHDRLAQLGADLLLETLIAWKAGRIQPQPQDNALATYAPPIHKEELRLQWHLPACRIANIVNAFDPVPGAYAFYQGKRVKCFKAAVLPWKGENVGAGEVAGVSETGLVVLAGDRQALSIGELQLEGQRRLKAPEFMRGHPIPVGSLFD